MIMSSMRKLFAGLLGFALLICGSILHGDELDNYTYRLDRIENIFWRTAFSANNSPWRESYNKVVSELSDIARVIHQMRREKVSPYVRNDLGAYSLELGSVMTHLAFRRAKLNISGLKKTDLVQFRKSLRTKSGGRKAAHPDDAGLSLKEYREFLDDTKDANIKSLESKFNNRAFSDSQQRFLQQVADKFYTVLCDARYMVLMLRQQDPVFKSSSKSLLTAPVRSAR